MLNTRAKKKNNLHTARASPCSDEREQKKINGGYHADSTSHSKKRKDFISMPRRATWFYARNV
jgi:hypothetical protein